MGIGDGTYEVIIDDQFALVCFGMLDFGYQLTLSKHTHLVWPWMYGLPPGKQKPCVVVMLLMSKHLCMTLFGVPLELDYSISNFAKSFVDVAGKVFPGITPLQCFWHLERQFTEKKSVLKYMHSKDYNETAYNNV